MLLPTLIELVLHIVDDVQILYLVERIHRRKIRSHLLRRQLTTPPGVITPATNAWNSVVSRLQLDSEIVGQSWLPRRLYGGDSEEVWAYTLSQIDVQEAHLFVSIWPKASRPG